MLLWQGTVLLVSAACVLPSAVDCMRSCGSLVPARSLFSAARGGVGRGWLGHPRHRRIAVNLPRFSSTHPSTEYINMSSVNQVNNYTEYEFWVRRLYATNMFHPVKMGLTNIQDLHAAFGSPMDDKSCTVIHIAGTNGKGSVALKIARTLELAHPDWAIGLFCSPHVSSFRERMQCNGQLITEDEVVQLLPEIYATCRTRDIPATFFEITTALAFNYFSARKKACRVVVLETGLGGRLDATNVVKAPALSVITSIGLEHTRILGDTIELIAREKGGIIKKDRPVLVGPHVPHDVLRACAVEKQASGYYTCDDVLGHLSADGATDDDYDLENARIATAALALLKKSHPEIVESLTDDIIHRGTTQRPPCRFEHVQCPNGVSCILDVAHNPPAMEYMVRKLQATYPDVPFRIVVGMSADKDLTLSTAILLKATTDASRLHFCEAAHPRAAKLEAIVQATTTADFDLSQAHLDLAKRSVTLQITKAMELAKEKGEMLVVCGSVFLMAEAREALGFDEPRDSAYIAELAGAGVRHSQENFGNSTMPPTL